MQTDTCVLVAFIGYTLVTLTHGNPYHATHGDLKVTHADPKITREGPKTTHDGLKVTHDELKVTHDGLNVTRDDPKVTHESHSVTHDPARATSMAREAQTQMELHDLGGGGAAGQVSSSVTLQQQQQQEIVDLASILSKVKIYQPEVAELDDGNEGPALTDAEWRLAGELPASQYDNIDGSTTGGGDGRRDPLAQDELFEGDIVLSSRQELVNAFMTTRNAIADLRRRWEGGVVPYTISSRFTRAGRLAVAGGIRQIQTSSCVRFQPRLPSHRDHISFVPSSMCSSYVGRQDGRQAVRLAEPCLTPGVVAHELMHALGFWHEQARADRDQYITVVWSNISPDKKQNFARRSSLSSQTFGAPYDYGSVMHYSWNNFAKDPASPTIIVKRPGVTIGQRVGLSATDIFKINALYDCGSTTTTTTTPVPPTTVQPVPQPTITTNSMCEDLTVICVVWAAGGECAANPAWMTNYCPRSCNSCYGGCVDSHVHCRYWAIKGQCVANPRYMLANCPRSCSACHYPNFDPNCVDNSHFCDYWARLGHCQSNPKYMFSYCKLSCNQC